VAYLQQTLFSMAGEPRNISNSTRLPCLHIPACISSRQPCAFARVPAGGRRRSLNVARACCAS